MPQEKLAHSLEMLKQLQEQHIVAIRSSDLSRTHRERLVRFGFLQEVIKGWYIASNPDQKEGETTIWYASFWDFCTRYLNKRFGQEWCIGPEQSLLLHGGNRNVPAQLLVRARRGNNKPTTLLHGTSLFDIRASMPPEHNIVNMDFTHLERHLLKHRHPSSDNGRQIYAPLCLWFRMHPRY